MIYNTIYGSNPISKIMSIYPELYAKAQQIATTILKDPNKIIYQSIKELAAECGTSESSVVRFCKQIGYSGYNEFKLELAKCTAEMETVNELLSEAQPAQSTLENLTREILTDTSTLLQKMQTALDYSTLELIISTIADAKVLFINGYMYSGLMAFAFCERMKSLGIPSLIAWDSISMKQNSIMVNDSSAALFLSRSGASKDSVENAMECKKNGAKVIVLTSSDHSPLAKEADILLTIPSFSNSIFEHYFPKEIAFQIILDIIYSGVSLRQKESLPAAQKTQELEYEILRSAIMPYPPNSRNNS